MDGSIGNYLILLYIDRQWRERKRVRQLRRAAGYVWGRHDWWRERCHPDQREYLHVLAWDEKKVEMLKCWWCNFFYEWLCKNYDFIYFILIFFYSNQFFRCWPTRVLWSAWARRGGGSSCPPSPWPRNRPSAGRKTSTRLSLIGLSIVFYQWKERLLVLKRYLWDSWCRCYTYRTKI